MSVITRRDMMENAVYDRMIEASAHKPGAWPSTHNMRLLATVAVDEALERVALAQRLTNQGE
jgi:hypothetical protein